MKTRYTIDVTAADIARAERNSSYRCVVAQAVARSIPEAHHINVDLQSIKFTADGDRFNYLTPQQAAQYIVAFDAGDPILPFAFKLRDPRITRSQIGKTRVPGAAVHGSPEHIAKIKAAKEANKEQTAPLTDSRGGTVQVPVMPRTRTHPGGKTATRAYGSRALRINRDRFAIDSPEMPVSPE